jgi:hypothetical protein
MFATNSCICDIVPLNNSNSSSCNNSNNNNNNNNKPDIIIRDNKKGTCMLIDVAISGVRNVIKKKPTRL